MSTFHSREPHTGEGWYEIRIKGHLAPRWATRFKPMILTTEDGGTTLISGPVVDQAALHGLLNQLSDLGLPLISVTPSNPHNNAHPVVTDGHTWHKKEQS